MRLHVAGVGVDRDVVLGEVVVGGLADPGIPGAVRPETALPARAVAAFAATRSVSADRPQGSPGATSAERWAARPDALRPVSEQATQEPAVAPGLSAEAAQGLLGRPLTPCTGCPSTPAALDPPSPLRRPAEPGPIRLGSR
ncbi:hypothetical protein ACI79J_18060 [Geodermatophilus sp. SYSU D01062]